VSFILASIKDRSHNIELGKAAGEKSAAHLSARRFAKVINLYHKLY
jgi:hypothetical protein